MGVEQRRGWPPCGPITSHIPPLIQPYPEAEVQEQAQGGAAQAEEIQHDSFLAKWVEWKAWGIERQAHPK